MRVLEKFNRFILTGAILFQFVPGYGINPSDTVNQWVDDIWGSLSLQEKVGQLFCINVTSTNDLQKIIVPVFPGGLAIEDLSPNEVWRFGQRARDLNAKLPFLLMTDLHSLKGIVHLPHSSTVANVADHVLVEDYNETVSWQLNSLGFHLDPSSGVNLDLKIINFEETEGLKSLEAFKKALFENDVVRVGPNYNFWLTKAMDMIKSGEFPGSFFEAKVKKIIRAKHYLTEKPINQGLKQPDYLISYLFNDGDILKLQFDLYSNSFRVINDRYDRIPVYDLDNRSHALLLLGKSEDLSNIFNSYLNKYYPTFRINNSVLNDSISWDQLKNFDRVFVHCEGIPSDTIIQLLSLLDHQTELYIIFYGDKKALSRLDSLSTVIWQPELNEITSKVGPQILFGGIPLTIMNGKNDKVFRLSYQIPECAGVNALTLSKIDQVVENAIENMSTPGCQVLVARDGKVIFDRSYGTLSYEKETVVTSNTVYDLASITKVMSTLPALMYLNEQGLLDTNIKASFYLEDLRGTNKENIIIRDILVHQSGLYPYLPFWRSTVSDGEFSTKLYTISSESDHVDQLVPGLYPTEALHDSLWKWTLDSRLIEMRSSKMAYDYSYSDFGFFIMKELAEKTLMQPLDSFILKYIYNPMGLWSMTFHPTCRAPLSEIAPTEFDKHFRQTLVHGAVHDQTAAMLGGVAGHAGLFSNSNELAKVLQMYMQGGIYGGKRFFSEKIISKYTSKQYKDNRRGLGWDKPDPEGEGNTSSYASFSSFGHTGFTGTSVWADPEIGLIYVFLSNRVNPDAENFKLSENSVRTRIHDIIYEAVWEYEKTHY